jgi:hypothetical protein
MALTNSISQDWIVGLDGRGPVAGSPATLSVNPVTSLCRRVRFRGMVGKDIDVSGFGTVNVFRPGKKSWEADVDILVPYTGAVIYVVGDYLYLEYTIGANTIVKYCGYAKNIELGVDDDGETIMTITIKGDADGGTIA